MWSLYLSVVKFSCHHRIPDIVNISKNWGQNIAVIFGRAQLNSQQNYVGKKNYNFCRNCVDAGAVMSAWNRSELQKTSKLLLVFLQKDLPKHESEHFKDEVCRQTLIQRHLSYCTYVFCCLELIFGIQHFWWLIMVRVSMRLRTTFPAPLWAHVACWRTWRHRAGLPCPLIFLGFVCSSLLFLLSSCSLQVR